MIAGLIAIGVTPTLARLFAPFLLLHMTPAGIDDNARRRAAFIGEAAHESTMFAQLEENLYYRDAQHLRDTFPTRILNLQIAAQYVRQPEKLANLVYGGRFGNDQPGDGWRYRGRGIGQVTFKDNYRRASYSAGKDWVTFPAQLALPNDAVLSFVTFWTEHGCNALADDSAIDEITRKINPAMEGRTQRRQLFEDGLIAFRADAPTAP